MKKKACLACSVRERSRRVFVGMSGGVDSSVSAGLLKKQGYDVVGVHLRCFNLDGCADKDLEDARRAAEILNIPFYVWDYEKEYKHKVMAYMIEGYRKGITPNPDVMCNKEIKFGLFFKKALQMGADYVATGHYVRLGQIAFRKQHNFLSARKFASLSAQKRFRDVSQNNSASPIFSLYTAKDKNKDQSYFLWTLAQDQLKHCLFPLGDYKKPKVRKIAKQFGLLNANKKDSQGICFLGKVGLEDFLKKYIKQKKGNIVDENGNVLGKHNGIFYYTIGQRHGLHLDRAESPDSKPYYIADKILKTNEIVVARGENNQVLFKKEINLTNVNFINKKIKSGEKVLIRIRYRQPLFSGKLLKMFKPAGGYKLIFDKPQKFIAQGQSAVIYSTIKKFGELEMLGGGIIR
jgi:tRNA-specific 2-thiouridylase